MTHLQHIADRLHRTAKLALDTGEAATIEEAERLFRSYRMQVVLGPDVAGDAALQAAALTAVNCGARTLLGGVTVVGAAGPLRVACPPHRTVEDALAALGARLSATAELGSPTLVIGDAAAESLDPLAVRAVCRGWAGGVVPAGSRTPSGTAGITPAGALAGAIAVSEIFQRLRGDNPMACRRATGVDLWQPGRDWRAGEAGPVLSRLPAAAWIVGLGNLGQAYLWTLGLLPYGADAPELVLQDFDVLAPSNLSTSLLTNEADIGRRKTRAMAMWAEARGFRAAIVERRFAGNFRVDDREPVVALIGVDNALARRRIEDVGFGHVIEAGLGRGPNDFLGIDIHTFPASKPAFDVWREGAAAETDIARPAYQELLRQTGDRCGTVQLAGRSVGAPFVGAVAAVLVVAELLRLAAGGVRCELISCHLRDPGARSVLTGPAAVFNPGTISAIA